MSRDIRYFGPRREPAVLVEDFGKLRTGVIVWMDGPCVGCGKQECRGMVLGDCGRRCQCGKPAVRVTSCDGIPSCLCPDNVSDGQVFAVVDEPPAKAESRARRRKLVTS